jgi:hypothetical protein
VVACAASRAAVPALSAAANAAIGGVRGEFIAVVVAR